MLPKGVKFPRRVHVGIHPKGWMDKAFCLDWLKTVWSKQPGGLLRKKSMLVLDAFRYYRMPSIKKKLVEDKTELAIISGSMTKMLQPLDICINKPVKYVLCLL